MSTKPVVSADIGSLLSPAKRTSSVDDVVAKLRELLLSGQIEHGQKLPSERELARLLEVSRTTVREALRTLEAVGLVVIRVGGTGGAFFSAPDPALMGSALAMLLAFESISEEDLTEFRIDFEVENAELAAKRATDEELLGLGVLLHQAEDVGAGSVMSWDRIRSIDLELHERLPVLTHNAVRIAISSGIHDALARSFERVEPERGRPETLQHEVVELITKVMTRDGHGARVAMGEHLRRWRM